MRPASIANFERVVLLSIVIGIVNVTLSWDHLVSTVAGQGYGAGFVVGANAFVFAAVLLILFLISRRRSNVARWIWIVLISLGFLYSIATGTLFNGDSTVAHVLDGAGWLLAAISVWLLLRPDAAAWFRQRAGSSS